MFPFGAPIQVMRVQLWIKVMGVKCGAIRNILRNLKKDFIKMHFEHDDNGLGTW
jgi:hypothetical protein